MIKKISDNSEIMFILDNLRQEDKEELEYSCGSNWKNKVFSDLTDKEFLVLYGRDNKGKVVPIAMGGFCIPCEENPSIACVWLLSTNYVYKNKNLLAKTLKEQIIKESGKFKILYNYIYKTNFEAKKWLVKLGFKFDNPKPNGLDIKEGFEFFYKVTERN